MKNRNNRQSIRELPQNSLGKIAPQDVKMEAAVIGALIYDFRLFEDEAKDLMSEDGFFYRESYRIIFESFSDLINQRKDPDQLMLMNDLSAKGNLESVGGAYELTILCQPLTATTFKTYVLSLYEKHLARKVILSGSKMIEDAYDSTNDIFEVISESEKSVLELSIKNNGNDVQHIHKSANSVLDEVTNKILNRIEISGVLSGFKNLDAVTGGWQKTDLIILAARPSVGKTAFSLNLALHAAETGKPTAVFNLEMGAEQLTKRLLANISGVDMYQINNPLGKESMRIAPMGDHEIGALKKAQEHLSEIPLYIDDTSALTVSQLKSKCRRLNRKHGLELIVVDYLQLMRGNSEYKGNREQEIAQISRELKVLAKELKVPIIALSQLSRGVETRADKKPTLSDLRESGAIEQDADIVSFLYRATDEQIKEQPLLTGATLFDIQKHRNGRLDAMPFYSKLEIQKFYEKNPKDQVFNGPMQMNGTTFSSFDPIENQHKSFTGISPDEPDEVPF